jgi:hypothetical protein
MPCPAGEYLQGCRLPRSVNFHTSISRSWILFLPSYKLDMATLHDLAAILYAISLYTIFLVVPAYGIRAYVSYRRLAHIKGPTLAAWSNFWLLKAVYRLNTHKELYDVTKRYGMFSIIPIAGERKLRTGHRKGHWRASAPICW